MLLKACTFILRIIRLYMSYQYNNCKGLVTSHSDFLRSEVGQTTDHHHHNYVCIVLLGKTKNKPAQLLLPVPLNHVFLFEKKVEKILSGRFSQT